MEKFVQSNLQLPGYDSVWFLRYLQMGENVDLDVSQASFILSDYIASFLNSLSFESPYREYAEISKRKGFPIVFSLQPFGNDFIFSIDGESVGNIGSPRSTQILDISKKADFKVKRKERSWASERDKREEWGRSIEKEMIRSLKDLGYNFSVSSKKEDINGIDAWFLNRGKQIPVQMKFRASNREDIVLVVKRDYFRDIDGTDWTSAAEYIFLLSFDGTKVFVNSMREVRQVVNQMLLMAKNNEEQFLTGSPIEMKIKNNEIAQLKLHRVRREDRTKLFAYIPPKGISYKIIELSSPISIEQQFVKGCGIKWFKLAQFDLFQSQD